MRCLCPETTALVEALRIHESQTGFIPTVESSLEQASSCPESYPLAVLDESDRIIGFAMYGREQATGKWKIFRLLIDRKYQNRGYGRAATTELIRRIRDEHGADAVLVSYQHENIVARDLYGSFGFEEYGSDGDKAYARLNLTRG